jgi:N-acetylmuramoyl-L-alanine amidase
MKTRKMMSRIGIACNPLRRVFRREKYPETISRDLTDSGILIRVPIKSICLSFVMIVAAAQGVYAQAPAASGQPAASAQQAAQTALAMVILDPAHGGTDAGAHGLSGIAESDVVLAFARLMRISLEGQRFRVILTRQANDNPSFDDRSKFANKQSGDLFITLHVSSTGQPGTVRVYSYPLPQPDASQNASFAPRTELLPWDQAQFTFIDQSRKLAELIQIQMAQRFRGSSDTPFLAPVRQLRTVGAPAVAIEISSVSVTDRTQLDQMGPGLADGVARAVAAFRAVYESGGK